MPNQDLQKELKEKVKAGVKPSHLKKLKRSKSADDIPASPSELEQELALATQTIAELTKIAQKSALLTDQLTNKQKEIERLREQLETQETELKELKNPDYSLALTPLNSNPSELTELDQSLIARHQNLKDFFKQYEKTERLEQELVENIDYVTDELVKQDDLISDLRGENRKLQLTNQSLQRDLDLAHRAVAWRKTPLPNEDDYSYLKYMFYFLTALTYLYFTIWLLKRTRTYTE
jgi:chromosome segregation ATPase